MILPSPYLGLTILLAIAVTTVVYVKKRKRASKTTEFRWWKRQRRMPSRK